MPKPKVKETAKGSKGKPHPKREYAKVLYLEADMNYKEIADITGISELTIGKWAKQDSWKETRGAIVSSPDKLIKGFLEDIQFIRDQCIDGATNKKRGMTSGEADSIMKLAAACEKLDKKVSPQINMSVFVRFNNWLKPIDLDFVKKLTEYQLEYIQNLIQSKS